MHDGAASGHCIDCMPVTSTPTRLQGRGSGRRHPPVGSRPTAVRRPVADRCRAHRAGDTAGDVRRHIAGHGWGDDRGGFTGDERCPVRRPGEGGHEGCCGIHRWSQVVDDTGVQGTVCAAIHRLRRAGHLRGRCAVARHARVWPRRAHARDRRRPLRGPGQREVSLGLRCSRRQPPPAQAAQAPSWPGSSRPTSSASPSPT